MRGAFGVVRKISGFNIRAPKVVKLKSGLLSKTEDERQSRWQEHFCEVFSGKIETCRDSLITEPGLPIAEHTFRVAPQDLLQQFIMMSTGKGLGPDTISSDLLKCGGFPMSLAVSRVTDRLVSSERWPVNWKGGRLVELFKGKGDAKVCDASRGLLIGDHMAKGFIGCLKDSIENLYTANMPSCQHGAVSGGGSDLAHHLVLSAIDYAFAMSLSIFVLFVDLVKAFDKVLRELVMGFPHGVPLSNDAKIAYLVSIGLSRDEALWMVDYINEHGSAFDQWEVDKKVTALICGLHSKAWASYGESTSYIVTSTGGRQGCKLGAIIFNAAYSLALSVLHARLRAASITLRLRRYDAPFWSQDAAADSEYVEEDIIDAAFVDDEAIILTASSPKALMKAVRILLDILPDTFQRFRPEIS